MSGPRAGPGLDLALEGVNLEDGRLVLRFASIDDQLRARDAINDAAAGDYVVALTSVPRTPAFLRAIGLKPMSLGLDLRGGVHFMYQVDVQGAIDLALQRLSQDIRTQLRDERIPYTSAVVDGQQVRVTLRPGADVDAARKAIQANDPGIAVTNDTAGEQAVLTVAYTPERIKHRQDMAIEQNITTLRNRVNELGVSEPIVARQGLDRIIVQLPGVQDPKQAVRMLVRPPRSSSGSSTKATTPTRRRRPSACRSARSSTRKRTALRSCSSAM